MELTWWPVVVAGLGGLILAVALAFLLPSRRATDRRRPLANTARLTRLPEYRAVVRRQTLAVAMVLVFLTLLFVATVLASARPTESAWNAHASGPRDDIMLCIGAPVTDKATGEFLTYFARQATTYGTERIGLTSLNRRVVPLTRDYQFAAGRFGDYAQASQAQAEADAGTLPAAESAALKARTASFSTPMDYSDYAPTVADALALCLTGFPDFQKETDTRRSVIYLGPGVLRTPGDSRPSLYTDAQVTEMAQRAGAQVNAVATAGSETASLTSITGATGGLFFRVGSGSFDAQLDAIRAHARARDDTGAARRRDSPVPVLCVALALAGLLGVSLMAVRR